MTYNSGSKVVKKDWRIVQILGVGVFGNRRADLLRVVEGWIEKVDQRSVGKDQLDNKIRLIFTPNPEILVEAAHDERFRQILNQADINIPDGRGLVWASKILAVFGKLQNDQTVSISHSTPSISLRTSPLMTSLAGTDVAHGLVMLAAEKGWRVFYLGGLPEVAQKAGKMLEVEARESGRELSRDFSWQAGRPEDKKVIEKISEFQPDILLVALGQGKQERWLMDNGRGLKVKVGMSVGGAFDFWSGRVKRAPLFMRGLGLEWLYRLLQEPWRWRRQLKLIEFGWLVLKEALR